MQLPEITHLQFAILSILLDGEKAGREVREELKGIGVRKTGPAFYQLMSRLEDAKLVNGKYHERVIDGQMIRQRHYTLTSKGVRAHSETREFYLRQNGEISYA